eukprot:1856299-Pyramimonas_sp.AAC.1
MVGHAGMQKNRLQLKKCHYASEAREAHFIRPSNGHSSPGIKCTSLLCSWYSVGKPNILSIGLSCRADDTSKKRGIQFVHACPYLPGDHGIQPRLRVDSEALVMASLKNLLRDNMSICRSANGITMSAGRNGRIPPTHIV